MGRAFGIASTAESGVAAATAAAAEDLGYVSVWCNDTPGADGIAVAAAMAQATRTIGVGIGVVACDRRPPTDIASAVRSWDVPLDRLILGIGPGFSSNPLFDTRAAAELLRDEFGSELRLAVAAMGPRMCRLAGEIGDVVLLNWMNPARIAWARRRIAQGSESRAGGGAEVAAYVRIARGASARRRIREEAERYSQLPHYARHFSAFASDLGDLGVALENPQDMQQLLDYDEALDLTVLRALTAGESPSARELIETAKACAPQQRTK